MLPILGVSRGEPGSVHSVSLDKKEGEKKQVGFSLVAAGLQYV